MPEANDELERQRELIFSLLQDQRKFFDRPEAQQARGFITERAEGGASPFGPDVTNAMFADNADAIAAGQAGDTQAINRAFANAGLSGSGAQTSAILNSRSRAAGASRAGRRDITSRAALANFQARERAQQQLVGFLQAQQQAEFQAAQQEANMRSKIHATGDAQNVAQVTATPPEQVAQAQNPGGVAPQAAAAPAAGPNRRQRFGQTPVVSGNFVNLAGGGGVGPMSRGELLFNHRQNVNKAAAVNRFEGQRELQQAQSPFSRALGGFF